MITHEEARKIAQDMLPKQVGSISSRNKVRNYFQLDLYFKQQELKELRATKEHELLGLYQAKDDVIEKYTKNSFAYFSELERLSYEIKAKEKELEELK